MGALVKRLIVKKRRLKPDLVVATICAPRISLNRAKSRSDGLRSLVIDTLKDQIQTTEKFEKVVNMYATLDDTSDRTMFKSSG